MDHKADLESLIDRIVETIGFEAGVDEKSALLSHVLDELNRVRSVKTEPIPFEAFIQYEMLVASDKLVFAAPKQYKNQGRGTSAFQLQSPLLLFLLIYHRNGAFEPSGELKSLPSILFFFHLCLRGDG